jgi:alpha-L-fucosidase
MMGRIHACRIGIMLSVIMLSGAPCAPGQIRGAGNRPDRLEWFRDLGFGMFIHWNVDGTLGGVISHSMVGAADDYLKRYIEDLPKLFNPRKYNPEDWAVLAKLPECGTWSLPPSIMRGFACSTPRRQTSM